MSTKVYSYSDSQDVANSVGKYVIEQQNKAIEANGSFKIALSGGSLGKILKQALIDNKDIGSKAQWDKWEVYFSDERLVPLYHPDSNFGLFNEMVLKNLPQETTNMKLHVIDQSLLTGKDGKLDNLVDQAKDQEIAKEYANGLPKQFDLILLGCGPDGHTCSLFPGHKLLEERDELISYISDSPKPPPRRITFTFPVLENAKAIAFVATGAGKAPVLREIFLGQSKLPCALVNDIKTGVSVSWFVDSPAVEGVDVLTSKY